MKKLITISLFLTLLVGMNGCQKNKEYCWDCYLEDDPLYAPETFCGLTEREAKDIDITGYLSYGVYLVPRKCVKK